MTTRAAVRCTAPLLAGALATAAMWMLPAGRGDRFSSTLLLLPLAFGAAWSIERWMRERELASLDRRESAALVGALGALTVAAARAPSLGLAAADPLIAVGLLLALAYWTARVLQRSRPLLGRHLPPRPPAIFFWLPFLVYASLIPWTTQHRPPDGDEPYNLLIAHSLVFDHDADLANNYRADDAHRFLDRTIEPQLGDPHGPAGQVYSRHNLLLPLVLAVPYGIAGRGGALFAMTAITALLAWSTLGLARRYFPDRPGEVLAAWSTLCFAPPLLLYSSQVWVEVPAALLVVYGLDRIHAAAEPGRSWRAVIGLATAILLLPLIKIRLTLLATSLLALYCWRAVVPALESRGVASGDRAGALARRELRAHALTAIALTVSLALLATAILLHNQSQFGNPLKVHSMEELDVTTHPAERYLRGLTGLFFDGAFGLFASAPIWLIVLPALAVLLARRHRLMADAAFVVVPYLVFVAPRGEWYGGWSPPFRYGLAFLPLLGIALAQSFIERRRLVARLSIGALGAATLVLALLWVSAPGWTYNFANGSSRVLDHLGSNLGVDVARAIPSYVRPRAASWGGPLAALLLALAWRLTPRQSTAGGRGRWARPRRATAAATAAIGAALLLLSISGVVIAAARVPTKTSEVEDAYVAKSGGELNPPMWTIDRWRYRGAWLLPEGERIVVPVAPGGERVTIELEARYLRRRHPPLTLRVEAGDREIGSRDFVEES
ncbi:MAG TPA: hypothetical protein VHR17_08680, partial [Thermoanaerobaculia bacterium]|nr:hypothetical protein [Thermoanaerobaculia bacterium]